MKNIFANWRTSYIGLGMIITAGVHLAFHIKAGDADESTWKNDLLAILGGVGLIFAGDSAASAPKQDLDKVKDAVITGNTETLKRENGGKV